MASILLLEDEPIIAHDLNLQLQGVGHDVVGPFDNGEECINFLEDDNPILDVAIIDIGLKGTLDGIEVSKYIAEKFRAPLIFLTGQTSTEFFERAKKVMPFTYLNKPFQMWSILANVELAMTLSTLEREWLDKLNVEDFKLLVGELIKKRRKIVGKTQVEAAEELGINYRHYQDIEGGKVNLKLDTLFLILKFYQINLNELMCNSEES